MTDKYTETGPFDRPDPILKRELLVEEHDENTRLQRAINKQAIGNVAMAVVAVGAMALAGYKYSQEDVRYMMYDRTSQNEEIVWSLEAKFAPQAAAIHDAAQSLIWNMRRTAPSEGDIYINLDLRAKALERVNAPRSIKDQFLSAEEKNLMKNDDIAVVVSKLRTKEIVSPNRMVTVEWNETIINVKTGAQNKVDMTTDLVPTIHKPSRSNPSGVLFNLPTICIVGGECL